MHISQKLYGQSVKSLNLHKFDLNGEVFLKKLFGRLEGIRIFLLLNIQGQ